MIDMKELKDVVASRILKSGDVVVVVEIYKPEEDGEDFRCGYSISYSEIEKSGSAMGIDSVQALRLAMAKIDSQLVYLGEKLGKPIFWLDMPSTGFAD